MHFARSALPALLFSLFSLFQEAPAQQNSSVVVSGSRTFLWFNPVGAAGCSAIQAGTRGDVAPLELVGPGTVLSDGAVQLNTSSELLLHGAGCGGAGSTQTIAFRDSLPPTIPGSTDQTGMDFWINRLLTEIRNETDFVSAGAVLGADSVATEAICPLPSSDDTVAISRMVLFRFTNDFSQFTLDPEDPFLFQAGVLYSTIEVDAGTSADIGNGSRIVCFFAEGDVQAAAATGERDGSFEDSPLSTGAIVGLVIGGCAVLAVMVVLLAVAKRVQKKRIAAEEVDTVYSTG